MVCAVQLELDADALAARFANPPAAATEPRSIAVLPFRNLSGDPEQEYFADCLTIEIIAAPRVLSLTRLVGYRIAHQQCLPGYALPLQPTACGQSSLLAEHLVVKPDRINEVLSTAGSLTRTADALRAAGVAPWFSARCRT